MTTDSYPQMVEKMANGYILRILRDQTEYKQEDIEEFFTEDIADNLQLDNNNNALDIRSALKEIEQKVDKKIEDIAKSAM